MAGHDNARCTTTIGVCSFDVVLLIAGTQDIVSPEAASTVLAVLSRLRILLADVMRSATASPTYVEHRP